jgi:malate dehydrogenase
MIFLLTLCNSYAILVGASPRKQGMERSDLLKANVAIFRVHGAALEKYARHTVKVLVVGNPANTNCAVAAYFAPSIPRSNFSALTRLDHNRAMAMSARHLGVAVDDVQGVCIWGNHSTTQYPDVSHAHVAGKAFLSPSNQSYFRGAFVSAVQQRGAAVIAARKVGSAISAAQAICDHVRDWHHGTGSRIVSMAVFSGAYGIQKGVIYSYPVRVDSAGNFHIVEGLKVDSYSQGMMEKSYQELLDEWNKAQEYVK